MKRTTARVPAIVVVTMIWGTGSFAQEKPAATAEQVQDRLLTGALLGVLEIVQDALSKGADINKGDSLGTPLIRAAQGKSTGHTDVVRLLLAKGADPNARDRHGATALFRASTVDTVRALLEKGADPNVKDARGETSLVAAADANRADIVTALLAGGADPTIKDYVGRPAAWAIAQRRGYRDIVELLELAGARWDGIYRLKEEPVASKPAAASPDVAQLTSALDEAAALANVFVATKDYSKLLKLSERIEALRTNVKPASQQAWSLMAQALLIEAGALYIVEDRLKQTGATNAEKNAGDVARLAADRCRDARTAATNAESQTLVADSSDCDRVMLGLKVIGLAVRPR
jgi:hypothetical protein